MILGVAYLVLKLAYGGAVFYVFLYIVASIEWGRRISEYETDDILLVAAIAIIVIHHIVNAMKKERQTEFDGVNGKTL